MDRLILGANPLAGVDHFMNERARERLLNINEEKSAQTIRAAFEAGAQGFNFSPSSELYGILKSMKENGYRHEFGLYPILPDINTYRETFLTQGSLGMVRQILAELSWSGKVRMIAQSGLSILTVDITRAMKAYIDMEIERLFQVMPERARLRSTLIFEALTDMAVAFRTRDIITEYANYLQDKYHIKAGFVTRNLPRFVEFCQQFGLPLRDIVVMTPVNAIGFQMTPTREDCETTLSKLAEANVIAMSVLAGGQIQIDEAIEYLRTVRNVSSVAIGVSTVSHAQETFGKLKAAPILLP